MRSWLVVGVLAFGGFVASLTHTLVLPLLPLLPEMLGSSASATSWVATVTLLAGAVANPVLGRLGDMYGKRRMLVVCLGLLLSGSLVGATADTLAALLVGRALQGMAVGVIPLGMSILRDELPPAKVGTGVALVSATLGIGSGMGLPLSGLISDSLGWHALFWILVGASALALVLVLTLVPESPVRTPTRFDLVGAAGLALALIALLLVISKGTDWGWTGRPTVALALVAAGAGTAWFRWERGRPAPLVNLTVTLRRPVLATNAASVLTGFAMFGMFIGNLTVITLPAATGVGFGRSTLVAGVCQLPGALVMVAASPLSARISAAHGARVTLVVGALLVAGGYVVRTALHTELWHLALAAMVTNAGFTLAYGAFPALIMANVPVTETAAANAVNALARVIGNTVASAAAGAVLAAVVAPLGGREYPTATAFLIVNLMGGLAALAAAALARAIPAPRL